MSIHRELDYTAKIRSITRVEFGILSPEEIIKRSVAHVHKTTLYENNGEPTVGGLFDPRMGVIDRGKLCKTCHLDRTFCTGHAGHIELVKPVFQFQYIYIILRFLKSICLFCNKSLIDINSPYVRSIINSCGDDNQKLFMEMTELASKRKLCGRESDTDTLGNPLGCGLTQPSKYQKVEFKIFAEWKVGKNDKKDKEERKLNLTPEKISTLFAKIPREDAAIFGFSENWCLPHWLITNVLPVSPPSVRPSVRQYNNQRSEDDLTIKYIDIIKYNNILKKKLHSGSSKDTIGYYFLCLQFHVATLIDNESQSKTAVTRASNRPLRTYKQRLHSKDGRIRGNLMGKRVDFSARSVITPDPNISIDQLGVPEEIAMNLTSPEKVNRYNYHKLYKLILNGAHKYPGVKKIKKLSDGKTFTLEFCDNPKTLKEIADNLEEGDTVHRHLMDDDYVLFNRQPSLHKMSMMAHRVVVMKHSTFRLNVSATGPYNADFDGDEMNMHVPQSLQSAIELREIAAIPKQIISPANSEPIIVPVQDTLIGLYKITGDGVKFNRREAMSLLSKVTTFDGELPAPSIEGRDGQKRFWTGHQLVSLILPEINLKMENSAEKEVEIVQGKFLKGQVDKSISKKIVHIIFNDFGPKSAQTYLDNLQNMMTAYLIREGFSVGVGDLMVDQRVKGVIRKIIDKGAGKVNAIHHDIHQGTFSDLSFSTNSDAYEHRIRLIVGEIERDIENLVIKTAKDNRILQAILSGSKGTTFHFRSMVGIVGSQAVDGKRIPFGFSERTRSLPHFYKYDDGLIPKGFVTHSFIDGLSPEEFFFHAMGGREGLIDTAVKTAESGYIQRRLVKGLEDLKVHYDHTVRSAIGDIYQFIYGEDAINGSGLLEKQGLKFLYWPYNKISDSYRFSASDKWELFMTEDAVNRMKKTTDWKDRLDSNFKEVIESRDYLVRDVFKYNYETKIVAPLNLQRLIDNIKAKFNLNTQMRSNLTPFDVEEELKLLYADLQTNGHPHKVLISMIKFYFAPKQLIKKYRFNKSALSYMMNYLRSKYQQTRVDPGEMVGPLAAQSIGEISTQLTLNTFHTAGKASTVTTGGVARLKELMANSKKIKSPSIVVYLDEEYSQDKAKSLNLLHNLELTTIENIISSVSLYLDTNNDTNIDADKALIDIYKLFGEITDQVKDDNPWILRIKFNRAEMMERNISMNDLYLIIQQNFANVNCIYTDDNSGELIMRLKLEFDSDDNNADNDIRKMKDFEQKIVSTVVKGIPEISHVTMDSVKERVALTEGNVYTPVEERILITQGSNLREVLSQEHVDPNRTRSNDINEMLAMFGIEAARNTIIDEFSALVGSVSYRHVGLLADFMTHKGYIMPIDRHGINRGNAGPLAKSSFEETIEQLLQAGVFGKVDNMLGVSANIMMGHITPAGTGFPKVFLDEKMISDELKNRPVQPKLEKMSDQEVVDKFMNISEFCQDGVGINFDLDNIPDDKVKLDHIPIVEIE